MLVPIHDPGDPRVEPYRTVRERDLVGRQERFIAEGEVVWGSSSRSRFGVESLLLAENRIEVLADLLARIPDATPVYVAGRLVMDAIVGFPIHRGVLAVGRHGRPCPTRPTFFGPYRNTALWSASSVLRTTTMWAGSSATPQPSARTPC